MNENSLHKFSRNRWANFDLGHTHTHTHNLKKLFKMIVKIFKLYDLIKNTISWMNFFRFVTKKEWKFKSNIPKIETSLLTLFKQENLREVLSARILPYIINSL